MVVVCIVVRICEFKHKRNLFLCFEFRNVTHGLRTSACGRIKEVGKLRNLQIVTVASVFLTNENPLQLNSVNMAVDQWGVGSGSSIAMTTAGTFAVTSS